MNIPSSYWLLGPNADTGAHDLAELERDPEQAIVVDAGVGQEMDAEASLEEHARGDGQANV